MWLLLSFIAGFGDALRDALSKRAASTIPRPLITWSYSIFALPFLLPVAVMKMPEAVPAEFWLLVAFVATCHVFGGLVLVKALQSSDLSVCTPMIAFTPVFLLVIGPLLTGDTPSYAGIIGAILVVAGSYVLNISRSSAGLLAPFKALYTDRGPRLMLILALMWSITGSVDRIAVQRFDPFFWGSSQVCIIALLLIPIVLRSGALASRPRLGDIRSLCTIGATNCLALATYLIALQYAPVHYVICVKRLSIPLSAVFGRIMFNESLLADRLPGAILMLLGVVIISLWG
jgi:drug/metabolite transporter (DMT)-like permease